MSSRAASLRWEERRQYPGSSWVGLPNAFSASPKVTAASM